MPIADRRGCCLGDRRVVFSTRRTP